jgi:hypothetical protein
MIIFAAQLLNFLISLGENTMKQKQSTHSIFIPIMLLLAFTIVDPVMAMGGGGKGKAETKAAKMENKKNKCKKGGMHGPMGLTMTKIKPCKAMKFLDHFKTWVEITPEQEATWGAFSKTIKLQATSKPAMKPMMMAMSPVKMAEKMIAMAEKMIQMKKNTLEAYKTLQQVLDKQQTQLADAFLAQHVMMHKGMKKGGH